MKSPDRLIAGGGDRPAQREIAELLNQLPEVRPNELAIERVWRKLEAPAPARSARPRLLAGAIAGTLALVLVGFWRAQRTAPHPTGASLQMTTGDVTVDDGVHSWVLAPKGSRGRSYRANTA